MRAVKFLEEYQRICRKHECFSDCPMEDNCVFERIGLWKRASALDKAEKMVEIVEQWSTVHPIKTRLQDFLEKYPDAEIDPDENIPFGTCAARLGYLRMDDCPNDCVKCWNQPIE